MHIYIPCDCELGECNTTIASSTASSSSDSSQISAWMTGFDFNNFLNSWFRINHFNWCAQFCAHLWTKFVFEKHMVVGWKADARPEDVLDATPLFEEGVHNWRVMGDKRGFA